MQNVADLFTVEIHNLSEGSRESCVNRHPGFDLPLDCSFYSVFSLMHRFILYPTSVSFWRVI